jgi:hypothetical protein
VYQHPAVVGTLIRDRVAELRHAGRAAADGRPEMRQHKRFAAARRGIGWLLVDMGLRLAVPRGGSNHLVARGQR